MGRRDSEWENILSGQIANRELAENDLCASLVESLHLVVDNLPLCVDDGLVLGHLLNADLGVVLFGLEFELDVQADNVGVLKVLGLLLETGVGKRLFKGDTVDKQRVL